MKVFITEAAEIEINNAELEVNVDQINDTPQRTHKTNANQAGLRINIEVEEVDKEVKVEERNADESYSNSKWYDDHINDSIDTNGDSHGSVIDDVDKRN